MTKLSLRKSLFLIRRTSRSSSQCITTSDCEYPHQSQRPWLFARLFLTRYSKRLACLRRARMSTYCPSLSLAKNVSSEFVQSTCSAALPHHESKESGIVYIRDASNVITSVVSWEEKGRFVLVRQSPFLPSLLAGSPTWEGWPERSEMLL
jgi:hypothetical protein